MTKSTEHGEYGYVYDDVSRLTNAANPTQDNEAYLYDGVGNRLASVVTNPIVHNENNELLLYGEMEYTYDANGNMTQKRIGSVAVNYVYNAENRLVKVEDDLTKTVIAEYYYDPFGRRLWKDVGGIRTYFFYADEGLVAEYDANGNELRSYGYQPDSTWTTDPLWLKQGGQYYWYQNDHLGTPQKLVAQNGAVVWEARYDAFGKAQVQVETVTNNLRFPGQYYDAETGLHYNWFRYYDPQAGRYTQTDLIGFGSGDMNWYAYVGMNPVNWGDFMGLKYTRSCDVDKQKFFNWLKAYIPQMAKDLNVPENLLWALAAKEGGWSNTEKSPKNPKVGKLDQNIKDNNPFGRQTPQHQNKEFPSLPAAIEDWKTTGVEIWFGDRVKGKQTPQEFADALQCIGIEIPEGKICKKYNSETKTWAIEFIDRYNQVVGEPDSPEEYKQVGFKDLCRKSCDLGEE